MLASAGSAPAGLLVFRRRRGRARGAAAVLALLLACVGSVDFASAGEGLPTLRILADHVLPPPIDWAFDIRWLSEDSVAIAAGRLGVYQVSTGEPNRPPRRVPGSESFEYASRLAVSEARLAVAAPFGPFGWTARDGSGQWRNSAPMAVIMDVDVASDRVLFLGARRLPVPGEERPRWAPEGGILFVADWDDDLSAPQLLMTAASGPDGRAVEMARCYIVEPGAVRGLTNGRYVVVPGVQPGIYVYSESGRLLRAWSSTAVGIYDRCEIDEAESTKLAGDLRYRLDWWQRHVVIDDVVPWGDWFALLIRTPREQGAQWHLIPYDGEGPLRALAVPIQATSPGIHLRGDLRGDRLAILVYDREDSGGSPRHRPRLVVLDRSQP